jgi:hypothetical protein
LQELRKNAKARDSKEEMLVAIEVGKTLTSVSKSRGVTILG